MKKILTWLFCACSIIAVAQDENLRYSDFTYVDFIKTVRLTPTGLPLMMPIVSRGTLLLQFDDMDADVKTYTCRIEPCTPDWQPETRLLPMDYMEGFEEDYLRNFEASFNTLVPYTHWELQFPNANIRIKRPGNYLLKIYVDDDYGKRLAITRRFIINGESVVLNIDQQYPANIKKFTTHQEFDFSVIHKDFRIANPLVEVMATVVQNGRWDNAIYNIKPNSALPENIKFDLLDKIVFGGGREWRWFDCRSARFLQGAMESIEDYDESMLLTLKPEFDKQGQAYLLDRDVNGDFVIWNNDFRDGNPGNESDYVNIKMQFIPDQPLVNEDLYVMGAITEWMPKPDWKMELTPDSSHYELTTLVKQGFYNYAYVPKPRNGQPLEWDAFEGNFQEANNSYTFIIYYRPFGAPSWQVIGVRQYDSERI